MITSRLKYSTSQVDRALDGLAAPREVHHARLVAALEQPDEQLGVDLPLKMRDGPPLAGGLDLVEGASGLVLDVHQRSVMGPPEHGREAVEAGRARNATSLVANVEGRALG